MPLLRSRLSISLETKLSSLALISLNPSFPSRPSISDPPHHGYTIAWLSPDKRSPTPLSRLLRDAGISAFAAHNWRFEAQWLGNARSAVPRSAPISALSEHGPTLPAHNNQTLRYWLKPRGLSALIASTAHRALPDAYVTAFILRELLQVASFEELVDWTAKPALLPRVPFGKHRGCQWSEVPLDYLAWIVGQPDMNEDVKFTAAHYRRLRQCRLVFTAVPTCNRYTEPDLMIVYLAFPQSCLGRIPAS